MFFSSRCHPKFFRDAALQYLYPFKNVTDNEQKVDSIENTILKMCILKMGITQQH